MQCPKCNHRKRKNAPCKYCHRVGVQRLDRSFLGCLRKRYRDLVKRSKEKGWPVPDFTVESFVDRFKKDVTYQTLWDSWVRSGYKPKLSPSVDRIDPCQAYAFDNIAMVSWAHNWQKGYTQDRQAGTVDTSLVPVEPCDVLELEDCDEEIISRL
jgi:hypothetical protein